MGARRIYIAVRAVVAVSGLFMVGAAGAETIDLTSAGAQGAIGTVLFYQADPMGSVGGSDPFLRIQGSGGIEQGINSTGGLYYDTKTAVALAVNDLVPVTLGETQYYEFQLRVDEPGGSKSLISLDGLKLYLESTPNMAPSSLGPAVYDLGAGNSVLIDDALAFPGSGSGDMFMFVPTSVFGAHPSGYVYLYSEFGATNPAQGGFEEWSVAGHVSGHEIPEPATLVLFGTGALTLTGLLRRRALPF